MESSWALLGGLGVLLEGSVLWVSLGIPSSPVQGFRGSRVRVGRGSPRPIPGSARCNTSKVGFVACAEFRRIFECINRVW